MMNLYKPFFILFLCFINLSHLFAQNTLVRGTIKNVNLVNVISLEVNEKYLTNENVVYESRVLKDGSFAFAVQVNKPQYATLHYSRNKALVYLEPNDTLYIDSDANSFQYSLKFTGRGGDNNNVLLQYFKEHPVSLDPFSIVQYRKGTYYYLIAPEKDAWMNTMSPEQFNKKMDLRRENALSEIDFFYANNPGKLTNEFREFLTTDIYYDWAYHKLAYADVYKNKYGITDAAMGFLNEVPLNNDMIGNYWYREFLKAYFNYKNRKSGRQDNPYVAQFDEASEVLYGLPLSYFQSEMVVACLRSKQPKAIQGRYYDFVKQNPYLYFEDKVISTYDKVMKYAEGAYAPDFNLKDIKGQQVRLNNFRGSPVYLNFWASWCRPCMKKMNALRPYQKQLEKEGVVFLNISLDQSEDTWRQTVANNNFSGIHILAPGNTKSDVVRNYEVSVLPQFFLINKQGAFARKPTSQDPGIINESLKWLTKN